MTVIFTHTLEVRFRDCDPMGHANNAVYLTYLEQARFAHWREIWGMNVERLPHEAPGVILAHLSIDYRRPARYGDRLEVRIALAGVGRTSFKYDYEIVDQEHRLVATAHSVQVLYDYRRAKPVEITDEMKERLGAPTGRNA